MESMDNVREQFAALERQTEQLKHQTQALARQARWWRGIACGLGLLGLVSLAPPSQAADFACPAGDVACLIDAINQANAHGEANTITLAAGTYTLTATDNVTDGANGLPSVTSTLTIRGAEETTTILERATTAPGFRPLHVAGPGILTLERLTIRGGIGGVISLFSTAGGGILSRGTLTLIHSTVADNRVPGPSGGSGGGIYNMGTLTLTHSALVRNEVNGVFAAGGGGVANVGTLTLTQSSLAQNVVNGVFSTRGGSIDNLGTLTLTNSTIADNTSIGIMNFDGVLILLNSTLAHNVRGGIDTSGTSTVTLQNTILALTETESDCQGSITSLGNNVLGDPTGCDITLLDSDLTGDPGLDTFTDDGTPGNGHFPLLPTSQAIDAGNDAACPPTDQLGQPRVGPCDIGAIEFQGGAPVAAPRGPQGPR